MEEKVKQYGGTVLNSMKEQQNSVVQCGGTAWWNSRKV